MLMRANGAVVVPRVQKKAAWSASGTNAPLSKKEQLDGALVFSLTGLPTDDRRRLISHLRDASGPRKASQLGIRAGCATPSRLLPRLIPSFARVSAPRLERTTQFGRRLRQPLFRSLSPLLRHCQGEHPSQRYTTYDGRSFVSMSSPPLRSGEMAMAGRRDNACVFRMPSRMVLRLE